MQLPMLQHLWGFRHLAPLASAKAMSAAERVHQSQSPRLLAGSIPQALDCLYAGILPVAVGWLTACVTQRDGYSAELMERMGFAS